MVLKHTVIDSPIGEITLVKDGNILEGLYQKRQVNYPSDEELGEYVSPQNFGEPVSQINQFFTGTLKHFTLPLHLMGTALQMRVWEALQEIPYGERMTYKELAELLGEPKAIRAVASAVAKNRLTIVIPCHRVHSSNPKNEKYSAPLENKRKLNELEASYS